MRVLLLKLSSMGDVIHTLPALTDAMRAIPEIKFTWVVEEGFQEIAHWHPAVEKIIPIALRKRKWSETFAAIKQMRHNKFDLVIDAQGLMKSAAIARLARAKVKAGLDRNSAWERPASFLYNNKVAVSKDQHAVDRVRQLFAKILNYPFPNSVAEYGVKWQNVLEPQIVLRPYIVFLHGTTWESKHWPEKYWLELAQIAAKNDYAVHVTWATPEQKLRAQRLEAYSPNVVRLPHLTINQAASVLHSAIGVVAVDTGFAHLSAALSKPMVAIYGPTDIKQSGTVGKNNINLASKFACAPCDLRVCNYAKPSNVQPACMQEITPDVVWRNLANLI